MVLLDLLGLRWAYLFYHYLRPVLFVAHGLGGLICQTVSAYVHLMILNQLLK